MKQIIRKQKKEERNLMSKQDVLDKSYSACENFLKSEPYRKSKVLMLYMPLGNETDPSEIIRSAYQDGKKVVFPVTEEKSGLISPRYAQADTSFLKGGFSVMEPVGTRVAEKGEIDTVLVPGIAFDRQGNRIGFGKGCYDQFLCGISAVTVGFCYEFQLCSFLPSEPTDQSLDFIVTEKEMFECK